MALNIGIRSDIPLSDAYSDLSNRFSTGKSMTGGAGGGCYSQEFVWQRPLFYWKLQNNVSSL